MVHATYIITLCWLSANGTIFLYINSLGLRPRDFKYKSIVHLPNAINRVTIKTICKLKCVPIVLYSLHTHALTLFS